MKRDELLEMFQYWQNIANPENRMSSDEIKQMMAGNGCVLVPIEPTEAMVAAGEFAWMTRDLSSPLSAPLPDCYKAMIEASDA